MFSAPASTPNHVDSLSLPAATATESRLGEAHQLHQRGAPNSMLGYPYFLLLRHTRAGVTVPLRTQRRMVVFTVSEPTAPGPVGPAQKLSIMLTGNFATLCRLLANKPHKTMVSICLTLRRGPGAGGFWCGWWLVGNKLLRRLSS